MSSPAFPPSALLLAALLLPLGSAHGLEPDSQPIGCELADTPVTVASTSHLDPSCTWTRGIQIVASDVTLDCQGALIAAPNRRYGVHIVAPTDVPLSNVTVRNCHFDGFLNSVHIEREGFRDLPAGMEYDSVFSDIVVEDSTMRNSRGVGIFVNGYVTDVTLRRLHIENTGSAGIYLETGSKGNVVEDNEIVNNGYRENGPDGQLFEIGGTSFWFWGPGREGIAIDGSRDNVVRNNRFSGNSAGGIFLYKNCGEFPERDRYFERRYGAHGNLIERNIFVGEDTGIWVASRMGENTLPMNCTDPQYAFGYVLDYANDNVIRDNTFERVTYGVRVEDDRNTIEGNVFASDDPAHVAIIVGTPVRTSILGLPVDGTRITGNRASIAGSKNPYRWVHGHVNTTFADNRSADRPVGICTGAPPARGPFVMSVAVVPYDPDDPPTGEPPVLPPPDPLPPCPLRCDLGGETSATSLSVQRLATPPGDDKLKLRGRVALAYPFEPALDPVETGVGVAVTTAAGTRLVDTLVPGGAWDPTTRVGWRVRPDGTGWKYRNRSDSAPGDVRAVTLRDRSRREPGVLQFEVVATGGSYPLVAGDLPLDAMFTVDPPTAEAGQCADVRFVGAGGTCTLTGRRARCR